MLIKLTLSSSSSYQHSSCNSPMSTPSPSQDPLEAARLPKAVASYVCFYKATSSGFILACLSDFFARMAHSRALGASTPSMPATRSLVIQLCFEIRRGQMLEAGVAMLRTGGLLLVSLPKACFENSRFYTRSISLGQMRRLGLKAHRVLQTNALALVTCRRLDASKRGHTATQELSSIKRPIRLGQGRNNFRVVFPPRGAQGLNAHLAQLKGNESSQH